MNVLRAGERLGPYGILTALGRGGTASLWLAHDPAGGRMVVLKVLGSRDGAAPPAELAARLGREVELLRRVEHPNVVRALGPVGAAGGALWFPLEFVQGVDLAHLLAREGPMEEGRARTFARAIAGGLGAVHEAGVLPRDLKPANVMVGAGDRPILVDFGLSVAAALERITATGAALGTPPYMAPEQLAGARDLDARADLHAFGVLVYEMLAGARPWAEESIGELRVRKAGGHRPIATLRPGLEPAWPAWFDRALALRPGDRFASAEAAARALPAGAG